MSRTPEVQPIRQPATLPTSRPRAEVRFGRCRISALRRRDSRASAHQIHHAIRTIDAESFQEMKANSSVRICVTEPQEGKNSCQS
jgi:hypothetical protein